MHGFIRVSQTNFLALKLTKVSSLTLFQKKHALYAFFITILSILLISSCTTKSARKPTNTSPSLSNENIYNEKTAQEKLNLAKALNAQLRASDLFNTQSTDNDSIITAQQVRITNLIIDACELFVQEKNYPKALWLANQLSQNQLLITSQNHNNNYRLLLAKARSLLALNYHQQALQQLQLARELVVYSNKNTSVGNALSLTLNYYQVLNQALIIENRPVLALQAQLNAFALNVDATNDDIESIWKKLAVLTQWQVAELIKSKAPFITGWVQLLNYAHKFGADAKQFTHYLQQWQQDNPTHPATAIIAQLQPSNSPEQLATKTVNNIAVLLPLTGNQKNAGLAAQQGILAAYNSPVDTHRNLFFIDTNQLDWQNLAQRISKLNIDHIIGPILKPNVEKFLTLTAQQVTLQIPSLLLNLPAQQTLANYQAALSMRPEDEAIQAAATLSQHNYKKPLILSHNDRVSKRIALAFKAQWQSFTKNEVDIVYFDEGKQMQASLKESLDVNTSQTRIKQLNSRLKYKITSEPRNRRDIDMIYLVGSAAQTRLIKPYIDVNISPFATVIPVYASSRSHSNFDEKNNTSSTNDLQGLTFTQIPWLLTSSIQNKNLSHLSNKLWPKRTDSLSRIFAMGIDSYQLLDKVSLMKIKPYIRHFGQTGVLKLTTNNILTRSLIWGQYSNNKVIEVVMQ